MFLVLGRCAYYWEYKRALTPPPPPHPLFLFFLSPTLLQPSHRSPQRGAEGPVHTHLRRDLSIIQLLRVLPRSHTYVQCVPRSNTSSRASPLIKSWPEHLGFMAI